MGDAENNGKQYPSMDILFDDIDKALSASALSPLIWMLLLVIGAIVTPILVVYDEATWIWIPWVLPNVCIIQPLVWYYYAKRCRTLGNAVKKWNSDFGSTSGMRFKQDFLKDCHAYPNFISQPQTNQK